MRFYTQAFEAFILPARAKPQLWRLIAGLILFGVIYVGFVVGLSKLALLLQPSGFSDDEINMNTRPSMIVGLFSFTGGILGVWAAARLFQGRKFRTLLGPKTLTFDGKPTLMRNFAITAGVVFCIQGSLMLVSAWLFGTVPNQPLTAVFLFMPLAAVLLLIQTGAEEILFRGYIMQQLAARFASPLIWLVLPSLVFGVIHYDPDSMGDMVWWILITLCVSGLVWADLTRVTGNIGAAWGWHFVNNFMLLNFVTLPGTMEGFAWRLTAFGRDDLTPLLLIPDIGFSLVVWLLLRLLLRPHMPTAKVHDV